VSSKTIPMRARLSCALLLVTSLCLSPLSQVSFTNSITCYFYLLLQNHVLSFSAVHCCVQDPRSVPTLFAPGTSCGRRTKDRLYRFTTLRSLLDRTRALLPVLIPRSRLQVVAEQKCDGARCLLLHSTIRLGLAHCRAFGRDIRSHYLALVHPFFFSTQAPSSYSRLVCSSQGMIHSLT
jgi:hypothetical protein